MGAEDGIIRVKHYADAYEGSGLSPEEIWEECICDSLGDMNIFAMDPEVNPFMSSMMSEVKAAATSTANEGSQNQTRGSPEGEAKGRASREFDTDDLYTSTGEFYREVPYEKRHDFARSLANKTTGMTEGEIRTIYVQGYIFEADGYMHGRIIAPYNNETKKLLQERRVEYGRINENRSGASVWSEAVRHAERGSGGNISISRGRRSGADDRLSGTQSRGDTSRDNERVRKTFETKEDVKRIVGELKKLYGFDTDENGTAGKASRELDLIDYINEQADEEELARAHTKADESIEKTLRSPTKTFFDVAVANPRNI